ncbi:hypothetical protein VD659_09795 [Herbiconiux sp. 11R-BC]|uniref:hypothetical protein n=1 Tax=Herbiconiux sp. 11R-BC TaxID=3111637 RepID=UPI003C0DF4EA
MNASGPRRIGSPYLDTAHNRRLAESVAAAVPAVMADYAEPFLDGGAVALRMMHEHPGAVFSLSSPNAEVIATWEAARADVEGVIDAVGRLAAAHSPSAFAALRDQDPDAVSRLPIAERAARFVYLRGTAQPHPLGGPLQEFSGARYGRETVAFDEAKLREFGRLLGEREVRLAVRPLFAALPGIRDDDLVYLDAPEPPPPALTRELRSFVSTVTAKGAFVLAARASAGLAVIAGVDGGEPVWGNPLAVRAVRPVRA